MKKGDRVRVLRPDWFKGKIGTVIGIISYPDHDSVAVKVDGERLPFEVGEGCLEVIETNNEKEKIIMDYEKKYQEALKAAFIAYKNEDRVLKATLKRIFPELVESKDEKTRKKIISTIHLYYGEPLEDEAKEMVAWLEKQGEPVREDLDSEALEEEIKRWIGCEAFPEGTDITPLPKAIEIVKNTAYHFAKFQKPADWNEEDEIRLSHILRLLDVRDDRKYLLAFGLNSLQNLEKDIVWLKSLKDRIGG